MPQHDIFVSYSRRDIEFADTLFNDLHEYDFDVWLDRSEIDAGDDFPEELAAGIRNCQVLLVLWSKNAAQSKWVKREIALADEESKAIIPLSLDEEQLPIRLLDTHHLDFLRRYNKSFGELVNQLQKIIGSSQKTYGNSNNTVWTRETQVSYRSLFAEENNYLDPRSGDFAVNEWTKHLVTTGEIQLPQLVSMVAVTVPKPIMIPDLDKVVEPWITPAQPQSADLTEPENLRRFINALNQKRDTHRDLIRYDFSYGHSNPDTLAIWKFLRFSRDGSLEFASKQRAYFQTGQRGDEKNTIFNLIFILGSAWKLALVAIKMYQFHGYKGEFQLAVNMKSTYKTLLGGFAEGGQTPWRDPSYSDFHRGYDAEEYHLMRCLDQNLQFVYRLNVSQTMSPVESTSELITDLSHEIQRSYNLKIFERQFIYGTTEFPWAQYNSYLGG